MVAEQHIDSQTAFVRFEVSHLVTQGFARKELAAQLWLRLRFDMIACLWLRREEMEALKRIEIGGTALSGLV